MKYFFAALVTLSLLVSPSVGLAVEKEDPHKLALKLYKILSKWIDNGKLRNGYGKRFKVDNNYMTGIRHYIDQKTGSPVLSIDVKIVKNYKKIRRNILSGETRVKPGSGTYAAYSINEKNGALFDIVRNMCGLYEDGRRNTLPSKAIYNGVSIVLITDRYGKIVADKKRCSPFWEAGFLGDIGNRWEPVD